MYQQIKPQELPMSRSTIGNMVRADIEDFCEATGILAAEVKIPAGVNRGLSTLPIGPRSKNGETGTDRGQNAWRPDLPVRPAADQPVRRAT